jgi:hypothetical protein
MSSELPDIENGDVRDLFERACGVQDFIRKNFGLYHPPGDYKALREENLRRTQRALNGAPGLSPTR